MHRRNHMMSLCSLDSHALQHVAVNGCCIPVSDHAVFTEQLALWAEFTVLHRSLGAMMMGTTQRLPNDSIYLTLFFIPQSPSTFKRQEAGSWCVSLSAKINIILLACLGLTMNARIKEGKTFKKGLVEIVQSVFVLSILTFRCAPNLLGDWGCSVSWPHSEGL